MKPSELAEKIAEETLGMGKEESIIATIDIVTKAFVSLQKYELCCYLRDVKNSLKEKIGL